MHRLDPSAPSPLSQDVPPLEARLAAVEAQLRQAYERIAEQDARDSLKTQFLANISHDLRTPLTAVITHAEILRDGILGPLTPRQLDSIAGIINGGRQLLGQVGEILTYARGAAAYGPYGARGYAEAYNPRTGAVGATRQGAGVYGSWGSTGVRRGDQWASTRRVTNNVTDTTTRVTRTDQGSAVTRRGDNGGVAATSGGNVFAGHDGNVYRKQGDSWQKYDNGSWGGVNSPTAQQQDRTQDRGTSSRTEPSTMGQLDRDSAARSDGARRTQDASSVRSSGSSNTRSGSYRPSGGMRGGGGRRR